MTPPIPRRMLSQTAYVRVPDGAGGYGEERRISHVRLDASAAVRRTDWQLQNALRGKLFVDPAASDGAFEIPAGSLVRMEGEDAPACVESCDAKLDGRGRLHHWEVALR